MKKSLTEELTRMHSMMYGKQIDEQEFINKLPQEYKLNMRNAFRTEEVKREQKRISDAKWNAKEETKIYKKEWAKNKKERLKLAEITV